MVHSISSLPICEYFRSVNTVIKLLITLFVLICCFGLSRFASAAQCDPSAMVDNCTVDPDGIRMRIYAMVLCKAQPSPPTTAAALGSSSCEFIYNEIDSGGTLIELTGTAGDFEQLTQNLIRPPNGTYTHSVIGLEPTFQIKKSMSFGSSMTGFGAGHNQTTGKECWTTDEVRLDVDGLRKVTTQCGSSMGTVDWATKETYVTGGVYSGCSGVQYWTDENLKLAAIASDAGVYLEIHQLPSPISITENTSYIELDHEWSNWLSIETDEGSSTNSFHPYINCGSSSITSD
jgi:hypothetical protein